MGYHNVRGKDGRFISKGKSKKTVTKRVKKATKKLESYDMFILDESGSMGSVYEETVKGFNSVLDNIQKTAKKNGISSRCSLIKFSGFITKAVYNNRPSENADRLGRGNYTPNGGTPLYDAIGTGIEALKADVKDKKASVVIYIFTDGEENASSKYNSQTIKALIEDVRDNRGWTITFIGAGSERVIKAAADSIGIFASNTSNYVAGGAGTTKAFDTIVRARTSSLTSYSTTGQTTNDGFFSDEN